MIIRFACLMVAIVSLMPGAFATLSQASLIVA